MSMTFAGLTRSTSAATSVASRHAVPDALNQFISKSAAYCVGFGTTGGTCVIMLCRPGTSRRFGSVACIGIAAGHNECVHALILAFVPGSPHTRTNTPSEIFMAWSPYLLLVVFVLVWGDPGTKARINAWTHSLSRASESPQATTSESTRGSWLPYRGTTTEGRTGGDECKATVTRGHLTASTSCGGRARV